MPPPLPRGPGGAQLLLGRAVSLLRSTDPGQSGSRGSLSDDTTVDVIVCKELDPIAADATTPLAPPHYDEDASLKDVLAWKCS